MNKPLVSVIVPIYKVEEYLADCVDSIINQTYSNLEIILVDDGSPDNCPKLCDEYALKDQRIKVLHKPNGGLSDARDAGLEFCTGEYVAFVDSDDFIDKEMYEHMVNASLKYNADIVRCDFRMYGGSKYQNHSLYLKNKEYTVLTGYEPLKALLTWGMHCSAWDKLYRRDFLKDIRFIKGRLNEDIIFHFSLLKSGCTYVELNKVFYNYRVRPGSITKGSKKLYDDLITNSNEMKDSVVTLGLPVTKEMLTYEYTAYIQFCRCQYRSREDGDIKTNYIEKRTYLRKNILKVITDSKLTWRFKVWALIIVIS